MNIRKYYFYGLVPMLFITVGLIALGIDYLNVTIFLIGFIFPYAIFTPGLKEKVKGHNYRFSFLRFSLLIYETAYDLFPQYKDALASLIYPVIFSCFLMLLTTQFNLHFSVLGWLCWMLFNYLVLKKKSLSDKTI